MTPHRLIELWEPPQGLRLASVIATTYELQADFLEEDILPVALDLRTAPARGREFRLELERVLQDVEASVYFHPGRYQAGLRRTPRIDLIPLPEGRFPKLHAKVALLRFVATDAPSATNQTIRLIVGSANLTDSGYRSNIEVAVAVDDAPGSSPEAATAVRDATDWLENLVGKPTEQVARQLRDLRSVFTSRPVHPSRDRLRFVGLPSLNGFPRLLAPGDTVKRLTLASPFWPSGTDLSDVASFLKRLCGGRFKLVRLIGSAAVDEEGLTRPEMPVALVRALLESGAKISVAAADPGYGCQDVQDEDEGEFDGVAERRVVTAGAHRSLHAKVLLAEGAKTTQLAVGSFNLTRRGMGLVPNGNAEAGLLWSLPAARTAAVSHVVSFASGWKAVDRAPDTFVVEPSPRDGAEGDGWPAFLLSLRATRTGLVLDGDTESWPDHVTIRMRDIRARLVGQEQWFEPWVVSAPDTGKGVFTVSSTLNASWLAEPSPSEQGNWPVLPDLEAEIAWEAGKAIVPVLFEDKHLFPVVETRAREDEQSLIAWFLGLRPAWEHEDGGFAHGIDPLRDRTEVDSPTSDILSYLIRDFVHALPGIRNRLVEAGLTETGLRAALMGHHSPVELAREATRSFNEPQLGKARKTPVATAFQLVELKRLLETVELPDLSDGVTEKLRSEAIAEIDCLLDEVVGQLAKRGRSMVLQTYLRTARRRT